MPEVKVTEQEARDVAEDARQSEWQKPSFMKELFLGNFRWDLISPFPEAQYSEEFLSFQKEMKNFLVDEVDSAEIDQSGKYPIQVINRLREMGAFGMKIPKEYGGKGFTQTEYSKMIELIGAQDANLAVLLSAHQSIGVPQPLKMFGSAELKKKYLPLCAEGAISAFALTEPDVGSDPARLSTTVRDEGDHYVLNGEKLWCTNGPFASLLVVMARHEESEKSKISAFVVEGGWPGVTTKHRCHFMGLKAIENGLLGFTDVRVPKGNLIGEEGQGLKIALTTLNAGRLALPAGAVGSIRECLRMSREWSNKRVQWGRPVGKHEVVAHKLADMATDLFAMQAISDLASRLEDQQGTDIRIEAAAAKLLNSEMAWHQIDEALQIHGGRGYENERSLEARGETPIPIERIMRDSRINRIIEGSSEILHLFIAREAVDTHLKVAGDLISPKASNWQKFKAFWKATWFYMRWYPSRWIPRYDHNPFSMRGWMQRTARKLARSIFHGMVRYQGKLQVKQAFLFRLVDIGLDLMTLAAAISKMESQSHRDDTQGKLVKLLYRKIKKRTKQNFKELWRNSDKEKYNVARQILDGDFAWMEEFQN